VAGAKGENQDPYFAQVVGKAFRALDLLQRSDRSLSLAEAAGELGGAKSSVFRVLRTLETLGYVVRDAEGRYDTAPELRPADRTPYLRRLLQAGAPVLKRLHREFQETTSLGALFHHHIEVVAVLDSPHMIRMSNMVGRILPPHASSLGKSIAAFQPEERQEGLVRSYGIYRYTDRTITDPDDLRQEFARIRRQGFAVDQEENAEGGVCFGAPIFATPGEAVGAVSVSAVKMRLDAPRQKAIVEAVRRAARELSAELKQV
jgi:DNA-binding IclR family transcriptional regulator